jgi:predicted regulator of Ras-like GTPase activity (Roadblock/LC7/MglB family)
MKTPAQADLQRWSDEVARDPRSLAFLPLARAYRRQGLRDAAIQLCLRGLEHYPEHVDAHGVLALLHLEAGDHQKAADEWSIVLRYDPHNFEALRGMGFWCFEGDQLSRARQYLERAAQQRPDDSAVQGALDELGSRRDLQHSTGQGAALAAAAELESPPSSAGSRPRPVAGAESHAASSHDTPAPAQRGTAFSRTLKLEHVAGPARGTAGPAHFFDELLDSGPLTGALLVDRHGLVLAGRLTAAAASDASTLGAVLGNAMAEAVRTAVHLGLGSWRGVLVESEHALLHVRPVDGGNALVIAAGRDAPAGWLLRAATHAANRATRFVREYA